MDTILIVLLNFFGKIQNLKAGEPGPTRKSGGLGPCSPPASATYGSSPVSIETQTRVTKGQTMWAVPRRSKPELCIFNVTAVCLSL